MAEFVAAPQPSCRPTVFGCPGQLQEEREDGVKIFTLPFCTAYVAPTPAASSSATTATTATASAAPLSGDTGDLPSQFEFGRKWKSISWAKVMAGVQDADHYFCRSGLIRKDLLPRYDPTGMIVPETLVVTSASDVAKVVLEGGGGDGGGDGEANKDKGNQLWVLKLPDSSNAYGMLFLDRGNCAGPEVEAAFQGSGGEGGADDGDGASAETKDDPASSSSSSSLPPSSKKAESRVLQRYVVPRLVSGGRKFHIRALVLAVGKLDVYLYERARVLIATVPFAGAPPEETYAHITNQSHNRDHPDYDESEQNVELATMDFAKDGSVFEGMKKICGRVFDELSKDRRHFFTLPNCFELFGLDFMVCH